MPRPAKRTSQQRNFAPKTLVVDNGAYSIKAGFGFDGADQPSQCHVVPNCIARGPDGPRSTKVYVGDQLEKCKDFAEMVFRRPVEKGYTVNWDSELEIWKQSLFNRGSKLECDPHEANLILTEASNCPQALQQNTDQVVFEELEFPAVYRCIGSKLNIHNDIAGLFGRANGKVPECLLVIDSGYSHTSVTPILRGHPVHSAIRRLEVGGKLMTSRLKELISLRQFNLMDDTHLVNQMKEDACFVSPDFRRDIEQCWKPEKKRGGFQSQFLSNGQPVVVDYVLPDYHSTFRGRIKAHESKPVVARFSGKTALGEQNAAEDACVLGNERFVIPELLFNPGDIGLAQAGLAELVVQSLQSLPPGIWPAMLAHVLIVGGNTKMPGFLARFESELRSMVPSECSVNVRCSDDPITYSWLGGARLASNSTELKTRVVTRDEYMENGAGWTVKQFSR